MKFPTKLHRVTKSLLRRRDSRPTDGIPSVPFTIPFRLHRLALPLCGWGNLSVSLTGAYAHWEKQRIYSTHSLARHVDVWGRFIQRNYRERDTCWRSNKPYAHPNVYIRTPTPKHKRSRTNANIERASYNAPRDNPRNKQGTRPLQPLELYTEIVCMYNDLWHDVLCESSTL